MMLLMSTLILSAFRVFSAVDGFKVYQVTEPVDHGEGPTWDPRTNLLYFVDTYEGRVLSYDYTNKNLNSINLHGNTSVIIPTKTDPHLYMIAIERSIFAVEWNGKEPMRNKKHLVTVSQQFPTSRFNDGKADKSGRLWVGTMGYESSTGVAPNEGILYSISKETLTNPIPVIQPVNISNGLVWNRANDKFYFIDTLSFAVTEYEYDEKSGIISNPKVVFDLANHQNISGFPDGMTIDENDNLWIALMHGGAVIQVNPQTGNVLQIVPIPVQLVTSVTWGGPHLNILFVTTSKHGLSSTEQNNQLTAGSVFAVTNLGTCGLPMYYADIIDDLEI